MTKFVIKYELNGSEHYGEMSNVSDVQDEIRNLFEDGASEIVVRKLVLKQSGYEEFSIDPVNTRATWKLYGSTQKGEGND